MTRFLSDEWIARFNAALQDAPLSEVPYGQSVRAESGSFRVEERVNHVPGRPDAEGPLRIVLRVQDGEVTLSSTHLEEHGAPDVVLSLSYEDAAALSRGELDPTQALGAGRVHVRGDLSVLVASQQLLNAAAERLATLQDETTY